MWQDLEGYIKIEKRQKRKKGTKWTVKSWESLKEELEMHARFSHEAY